ncbi:hypothetical protein A2U01_0116584, partial [Trifolium medium]|nr:hypothetical protein [Trifolium medium]
MSRACGADYWSWFVENSQGTESDVPSRRESDLSLDYRLFEGTHAADLAASSAK